jgi:hypothetical protein
MQKISMSVKYCIFSTIIGILVGGLLSGIALMQASIHKTPDSYMIETIFYRPPWVYLASPILPIFIGMFSLFFSLIYPRVWADVETRWRCVILALAGYSLGWFGSMSIFIGDFFSMMMPKRVIVAFFLSPFLAWFHLFYFFISGYGVLLLIGVAYYVTRDIKSMPKKVLLFIAILWLGLWPYSSMVRAAGT